LTNPTIDYNALIAAEVPPWINAIQGWLAPGEAAILAGLAGRVIPGSMIVEVGTFRGKSTCALAWGARGTLTRIYTVDAHAPYNPTPDIAYGPADMVAAYSIFAEYPELGEKIYCVNIPSVSAAKSWLSLSVGLWFCDGDHRTQSVLADFRAWSHTFCDQSSIIFHDVNEVNVLNAICVLYAQHPQLEIEALGGSIGCFRWYLRGGPNRLAMPGNDLMSTMFDHKLSDMTPFHKVPNA